MAASGGGNDQAALSSSTAPGEIFLENAAAEGADPFTGSAAALTPGWTVPPNVPVTLSSGGTPQTAPMFPPPGSGPPTTGGTVAVRSLSGGTPGLYGGTGNQRVCDKQQMIDFLGRDVSKAAAFAQVQGIATGEVSSYVGGLTPLLLRGDTRVTNHGFRGGRATPRQAVLEGGTAVLVDNRGVPRVRCACGNPLIPPTAVQTSPRYAGQPWPGFTPGNVTVIGASPRVIPTITVINVVDGTPYGQPTGSGYPAPVPLPALPATMAPPPTAGQGTPPPATVPPGTVLPGTVLPGTAPPGTAPPGTAQPGTAPPTTVPPTTAPPTTVPPTTAPPTTAPPTTAPPTTAPPGTTSPCTGTSGQLLERLLAPANRPTGDTSRT